MRISRIMREGSYCFEWWCYKCGRTGTAPTERETGEDAEVHQEKEDVAMLLRGLEEGSLDEDGIDGLLKERVIEPCRLDGKWAYRVTAHGDRLLQGTAPIGSEDEEDAPTHELKEEIEDTLQEAEEDPTSDYYKFHIKGLLEQGLIEPCGMKNGQTAYRVTELGSRFRARR